MGGMPRREPDDADLPIELGPVSNGETPPAPVSPMLREVAHRARELIDRQSRRRGMDRRTFLKTSMASAAVLFALDACSSDSGSEQGRRPGGRVRVRIPGSLPISSSS